MKRCTKCGEWYPHTTEYFHKKGADRLRSECKPCACARANAWYYDNYEKVQQHRRDNSEAIKEYGRRYHWKKRQSMTAEEKKIKWARQREYRAKSPEKVRERERRYRSLNHENARNKDRRSGQRRRAREVGLPADYNREDENYALAYFNGYCAICGEPLRDLFGERVLHFDHWISISDPRPDNPGTVPKNMLPVCSSCNLSKNNLDPREWLEREYGRRKAEVIIERIERFFETVRQVES